MKYIAFDAHKRKGGRSTAAGTVGRSLAGASRAGARRRVRTSFSARATA
jgi:hypothetical protein